MALACSRFCVDAPERSSTLCALFAHALMQWSETLLGKLGVSSLLFRWYRLLPFLPQPRITIMANYLYLDANGQKQGPVNAQQLKALATQGIITPDTPLKADTGHQGKAGQIPGLFTAPSPTESNPFTTTATPLNNQTSLQSAAIPVVREKETSQWYQHPATVGIVMVFFFPIGLVLLWTHPIWKRQTKIAVSCIVGFVVLLAMARRESTPQYVEPGQNNADRPVAVQQQMGNGVDRPAAEQQQKEATISISADDLMQAYKDNQIAADQAYKGKILIVKGTINKMGGDNQPFVLLDTNEPFKAVQCVFPRGSESSLASLRTGQTIRIEGRCDSMLYSMNVFLQNCSIVFETSETNPSPSVENAENETNRPVQVGQPQTKIAVSATDLMQAYEDNQIAADAKYKGKILIVKGTINKMGGDNQPSVLLDTNNIAWGIQCVFPRESVSSLASLRTGQTIRIEGKCNGRRYNASVVLQDCSIVRP